MIPVLAVDNVDAARDHLARMFGFVPAKGGRMALGDQQIALTPPGVMPEAMIPLRLDHVALATADADATHTRFAARGALLAAGFTPDGPKDIPEFWEHGVRFVFFDGPEGWPMEFCAKVGAPRPEGHDHYAIRTPDLDAAEARLAALGAKPVAQHVLAGASGPVHVRFCTAAGTVFELFDEGPFPQPDPAHGWIGLLPG